MLRYACHLSTNVRPIKPLRLAFSCEHEQSSDSEKSLEDMKGVLGGRPVLTLAFDRMTMVVHQPVPVIDKLENTQWLLDEDNKGGALARDSKRYVEAF